MSESCFSQIEPLLGTSAACQAVGRARATHYRSRRPARVTPKTPRNAPLNKLSAAEVDQILTHLRSERFVDHSPAQVYFQLLDEGTYIASISTFYRLLRQNNEVRERRRQATHPPKVKPELVATTPNTVWSWDMRCLLRLLRCAREGAHRRCGLSPPHPARSAHHPRRSRQLDDLELGRRALHLSRNYAQSQPPACEQRQPLFRGGVQDDEVLPGLPRTLRLHRGRARIL